MQAQHFPAPWRRSTWIVTLAVIVLVVGACGGMMWSAAREGHGALAWTLLAGGLVLPAVLFVTACFAPLGYAVSRETVVIRRLAGSVVIRLDHIAEARGIESREIGFVVRVFGSGGFFGWFGRFYGWRIGSFTAYCSNTQDLALLTLTDGRKIVVSPYPVSEFLRALLQGRDAARNVP